MNPAGLRDLPELTEASRLPPQAHGMFTLQLSPLNPSHMEYAFLSGVPATSWPPAPVACAMAHHLRGLGAAEWAAPEQAALT